MSISVILPNYNHGHWLPRALRALVSQSVRPDEIIVIDDGSTDGSAAIIEDFTRKYGEIRLIRHDVNRGTTAAVKNGIALAKGDFLLFAAADDFILPGLIERSTEALSRYPQAALYCSEVVVLDRDGHVVGLRPVTLPRATSGYLSPDDCRRALHGSDNWFVGPSVIYRRSRLSEIGYFDETLGTLADAMATRLLALRYGFYFDAEPLATWRIYPESLSASSILSEIESRRLRRVARDYIMKNFPADMAGSYARRLDRRQRFNIARLQLVWNGSRVDTDRITEVMEGNHLDRVVLRFLAHLPGAHYALLSWIAARTRPFGLMALARAAWRNATVHRARQKVLMAVIAAADQDSTAAVSAAAVAERQSQSPSDS